MKAVSKETKSAGFPSNGSTPSSLATVVTPSAHTSHVDRHLQVLEDNRALIIQYIIASTEFLQLIREQKVLPESMLNTVQETEGRENRNVVMLDLVKKLGRRVFHKFCDVLDMTGHRFLADHLREEEAGERVDAVASFQELFSKFPAVKTALSAQERKLLTFYLRDKFSQLSIQQSWKTASTEKKRLAEERNKILGDELQKERAIKDLQRQVGVLQEARQQEQGVSKEHLYEINRLKHELESSKQRHQSEIQSMASANDASERSNIHTNHRVVMFDRQVKAINVKILLHFGANEYAARSDPNNVKMSQLEENVNRLFEQLTQLTEELHALKEASKKERKMVFDAMRVKDRGQHLKTAYFQSMCSMEDVIRLFAHDVTKLAQAFRLKEPAAFTGGSSGILDVDGDPERLNQQLEERMNGLRNGFGVLRVSLEKMVVRVQIHRDQLTDKDKKITLLQQQVEAMRMAQQPLAKIAEVQESSTDKLMTSPNHLPPVDQSLGPATPSDIGKSTIWHKPSPRLANQPNLHEKLLTNHPNQQQQEQTQNPLNKQPKQHEQTEKLLTNQLNQHEETKLLPGQGTSPWAQKKSSTIAHVMPSLAVPGGPTTHHQISLNKPKLLARPRRNSKLGQSLTGGKKLSYAKKE